MPGIIDLTCACVRLQGGMGRGGSADTCSGDEVDFDEALGGGDSTRIRLDSFWRFGDSGRHKVKAIAFDMSRDNSRTFDEDIEWGGDIYPTNAKIDVEFSFTVIAVAYEYAFVTVTGMNGTPPSACTTRT